MAISSSFYIRVKELNNILFGLDTVTFVDSLNILGVVLPVIFIHRARQIGKYVCVCIIDDHALLL